MSLKKNVARAVLPSSLFERLRAIRSRRFQLRSLEKEGLIRATAQYIEQNGNAIRNGPFAGTLYPLEAARSHHAIPKLMGTYEQELHGVIRTIANRKYDLIVDIGSAEGYYAVGLAKLLRTRTLAYDPEPTERPLCQQAAHLNQVSDLVELRDFFRPPDILRFRDRRVLCICDCEGFETHLFKRDTVSAVAKWDLVIELHGEAADTLPHLSWPHQTSLIASKNRCESYKELEGLGDQSKLLSEYRTGTQTWLWCDSRPVTQ